MTQTVMAVFDGKVLHPEGALNLLPNIRYQITIEDLPPAASDENAWDILERLSGSVTAPEDWAVEHDHYIYGTPKQKESSTR